MERIAVHIWSDLGSPRSFLGLLNLEEARAGRNVAVEHHAFIGTAGDDEEAADELRSRGIEVAPHPDSDTRLAHELIYGAKECGHTPEESAEMGVRASMSLHRAAVGGADISDLDELLPIAETLSLDPRVVKAGLEDRRWSSDVESDLADAGRLRFEQAPHIIVAGMFAIDGPSTAADIGTILDSATDQLGARIKAAEAEARDLFGWRG